MAAQSDAATVRGNVIDQIETLVVEHFYRPDFDAPSWHRRVASRKQGLVDAGSDQAFDRGVNQLLAELNASHTAFYSTRDPRRYQLLGLFHKLFDADRRDLFVYDGIGIRTIPVDGEPVIAAVYDGLPAARSGLEFGDRILAVDGQPFRPIGSFSGKAGETVSVQVQRGSSTLRCDVEVAALDGRTLFEDALKSSVRVLDRGGQRIGYVHAWSYAGQVYQDLIQSELVWGKLSDCDALVLDVRDGWGGADINYLNLFRPPLATMSFEPREGPRRSFTGTWNRPVALLTNGRSTSGKELLAYGFKKWNLGKVAGSRTAGAVLGGRCFLLDSGDVLYLATAAVTVDGVALEGKGVEPDIPVQQPLETEAEGRRDPQLQAALDWLSKEAVAGGAVKDTPEQLP